MPLLDWLNKTHALRAAGRVPFRLLENVAVEGDVAGAGNDNWLIRGDNLEALKALLPFFAGRVKCIYIDPPYNTRSAFEHYDDNLEHSQWLSMMLSPARTPAGTAGRGRQHLGFHRRQRGPLPQGGDGRGVWAEELLNQYGLGEG